MSTSNIIHFELQKTLNKIIDKEVLRAISKMDEPALPPSPETVRKYSYRRCLQRDLNTLTKFYWRGHLILSVTIWPAVHSGRSTQIRIIRHMENNYALNAKLNYAPELNGVLREGELMSS